MDMAEAYGAFATGGRQVEAWGVSRIRTPSGKVIWTRPAPAPPRQVIGNPALSDLNRMMRQVIRSGTGTRAALPGRDIAGKTGTTSAYQDAWFAGYTGGIITVVWLGRDDNRPMKGVTGGSLPAETWRRVMTAAISRLPSGPIPAGPLPPPPPAVPPDPQPVPDIAGPDPEPPTQPPPPAAAQAEDTLPAAVPQPQTP
jgi:penicillin-binding protein 1A